LFAFSKLIVDANMFWLVVATADESVDEERGEEISIC
jgi:hypothetical protein